MNEVIRYYYFKGKNKYDVGIIAVVYTFGKDIKWNPHVRIDKKLQDGVNEVIRYYYFKGKNKYDVGIIAVVYTFGKDIKWNPHVYALIT